MKLTKVLIRRYRSIENETGFRVESDITCLVGKNESGKTAVLQALYKSNPIETTEKFDEDLDYPSHKTRELAHTASDIVVTELTYQLDESDQRAVEDELGPDALASLEIEVSSGYRSGPSETWQVRIDELAVIRNLLSGVELPPSTANSITNITSVAELTKILEAMDGKTPEIQGVLTKVARWRRSNPELCAIDVLDSRQPKFVYFDDYDTMPGKVSLPSLIESRDNGSLSRGQRAVLALLKLAGVEPETFANPASHEHLVRRLENASNSISDDVFEYWSQNKNLQVELSIMSEPEVDAPSSLARGPILQIRVRNLRHRVTVPFDERSRGFVWFFSFLAYFSQLEEEARQPLVLLLDEPGLSLHATAQHDLLRLIEERLASKHQVVFSTHSPFMIEPRGFRRVRTVVDQEGSGTTVSADVLKVDGESAFPLHAALGIELTQTLFVGPEVLFVEGPSDVVFLHYLSDQLNLANRKGLDSRWVLVPGGGITKLPAFLTLFGANDLTVAVLTDSSKDNRDAIVELKKAGKLYVGGLVEVGHGLGRSEADVEDLFDKQTYLDLVNSAYAGALAGQRLVVADLAGTDRIVKDVEKLFAERDINHKKFNHFAAAGALMRTQSRAAASVAELSRAEKLFEAVNALLPAQQ